jgi:lipoprotein-anchoring transpeptidase ErfK/SrfK
MSVPRVLRWFGLLFSLALLSACGKPYVAYEFPPDSEAPRDFSYTQEKAPGPQKAPAMGLTVRVVTKDELERVSRKDPELSPSMCKQILANLNARASYYIEEDIEAGRPIKAPNDFEAYKNWTPLRHRIPQLATVPQFILIAKDVHFIGWYEKGKMVGTSYICVGKEDDWTRAGLYLVREKDIDHVSRSYKNAYGVPAPMPFALRAYEHVWIHAGDIEHGNCSHGCINLPLMPAKELFSWANVCTPVLIVQSMKDVDPVLAQDKSRMLLFENQGFCRRGE